MKSTQRGVVKVLLQEKRQMVLPIKERGPGEGKC